MAQITFTIGQSDVSAIEDFLRGEGFSIEPASGAWLTARRSDCVMTLYQSMKLLVQGTAAEEWGERLQSRSLVRGVSAPKKPKPKEAPSITNLRLPRIGTDESGKGDYFGALVVGVVWVDEASQVALEHAGVKDSKLLSDDRIRVLAGRIRQTAAADKVSIGPQRYNELHAQMESVNRVLGWAHARALEGMLTRHQASLAVADQFGDRRFIESRLFSEGKKVEVHQMPRAESDTAVAAASIIARDEFLMSLRRLSDEVGIRLPKGASAAVVAAGAEIARRDGIDALRKVAKWHFKTTDSVRARLNETGVTR